MEILFLGTGSVNGIPAWACNCKTCKIAREGKDKNVRLRPSIMITSGKNKICVDMGPDFRTQMLKYKISHLDHIFITHDHADHIASLLDLKVAGKVVLHVPDYIYDEHFKVRRGGGLKSVGVRNPQLKIDIFDSEIKIGKLNIETVKCEHEKKAIGRIFKCCGYLFKEKNFKFAYLSDFNKVLEKEKLYDLDLFVCDGAVMESKWGHVGIKGGVKLYKELNPKKMIFTHMAHWMPPHAELERYVKKFGNIDIAYDGMKIKV